MRRSCSFSANGGSPRRDMRRLLARNFFAQSTLNGSKVLAIVRTSAVLNLVVALFILALVAAMKGLSGVTGAVIVLARIVFLIAILVFIGARFFAPAHRGHAKLT
jgi:uncharacterized membrane protein YtjA (UPF0391 family)